MITSQVHDDLLQALLKGLGTDGFTLHTYGPQQLPEAVLALYDWPDHLDVVTIHRDGEAAAGRFAKPVDPWNPPPTALWAIEGPLETAIWAMLTLPHPTIGEAPHQPVATPSALRVPPGAHVRIQEPEPGRVDARAQRLAVAADDAVMSRAFLERYLQHVDAGAAIGAAAAFAEDAKFEFPGFPALNRTAAVKWFLDLHLAVRSVEHVIHTYWEAGDHASTGGEVTFVLHNGHKVVERFGTLSLFTPARTEILRHQVFVNPAALTQTS